MNVDGEKVTNLTPEKVTNLLEDVDIKGLLGGSGGSDGTRTRGLWRDRPAL